MKRGTVGKHPQMIPLLSSATLFHCSMTHVSKLVSESKGRGNQMQEIMAHNLRPEVQFHKHIRQVVRAQ